MTKFEDNYPPGYDGKADGFTPETKGFYSKSPMNSNIFEEDATYFLEKAIKIAISGGYKLPEMMVAYRAEMLFGLPWWSYSVIDPIFWETLIKALSRSKGGLPVVRKGATFMQHDFIDALALGKSPNDFFKEILK